jgi:hypothetical protein
MRVAASFADDTMAKPFLSSDLLVRVGRLVACAKA